MLLRHIARQPVAVYRCSGLGPFSFAGSVRCFAPPIVRRDPHLKSGAAVAALAHIREEEERRTLLEASPFGAAPPAGAVLVRSQNRPAPCAGSIFPVQAYPGHPHNFTPLRPIAPGFAPLDRAVRDIAWESRFDLLERAITPRYCGECRGTPRREPQDGLVAGIRVRPVQNPYVRLKAAHRYRLNTWPSKNWADWNPHRCYVRGSRRRYRVPEDIAPYKDELGEWHPPRVSGRYKGDIEKQYYMHSLPWVWSNDYFQGKQHFMDREPRGPKRWYKKEFRKAHIGEAVKKADEMVEAYRRERRDAKRLSWVEHIVLEFAGEQLAEPYVRRRQLPKK